MVKVKNEIPDCRNCGACCISNEDGYSYADVSKQDLKKIAPLLEDSLGDYINNEGSYTGTSTVWRSPATGPAMGFKICQCSFLGGDPGALVGCLIYEERPKVCRDFKPGSPACLHAIKTFREALGDQSKPTEGAKKKVRLNVIRGGKS